MAVVVAHELGHCTQALAMRLGYLIEYVNRWFYRVVYERDTWDDAFEEWANSVDDSRLALIVLCARFAVWLSRSVLAMLMYAGHAASCFLSRQMEYHADACSMVIAGSSGVESMLLRLRELSMLEAIASPALAQSWQQKHQLPESLPDFLATLEERLPAEFRDKAQLTLLNESAGLLATHPTAAQRIQKARQRQCEGLFTMEWPARALFKDFDEFAKQVTARHYRQNLRLGVTDHMLKPAASFFAQKDAQKSFKVTNV